MGREELSEQNLDMVTGGTVKTQSQLNQSANGNKKAVQQDNVNGKNEIKAVQYNTVTGNKGNLPLLASVCAQGWHGQK